MMGDSKVDSMVVGGTDNTIKNFSVEPSDTDGVEGQTERRWDNDKWTQYFGYFEVIPELNASINAKSTWTIGKGFKADETTTMLLDTIRGWGKDTFNTILENMIRTYYISGDAFCEIIRDDEDNLINLKPLNPGTIRIITGRNGIIKRYEQNARTRNPTKTFQPEQIFHLARNRVADQIHGVSVIASVENIIIARNAAISGYTEVIVDETPSGSTEVVVVETSNSPPPLDGENDNFEDDDEDTHDDDLDDLPTHVESDGDDQGN